MDDSRCCSIENGCEQVFQWISSRIPGMVWSAYCIESEVVAASIGAAPDEIVNISFSKRSTVLTSA